VDFNDSSQFFVRARSLDPTTAGTLMLPKESCDNPRKAYSALWRHSSHSETQVKLSIGELFLTTRQPNQEASARIAVENCGYTH
jgi:hypothetical protein